MTNTTLSTSAELFRQISYIADDENSMRKLLNYVKKLTANHNQEPVMTKEEILSSFKDSLEELKLEQEGKVKLTKLEDFYDELRQEGYLD